MDKTFLMSAEEYHKIMSELDFLRSLVLDLYFGNIDNEQFLEKLRNENDKYTWWC